MKVFVILALVACANAGGSHHGGSFGGSAGGHAGGHAGGNAGGKILVRFDPSLLSGAGGHAAAPPP